MTATYIAIGLSAWAIAAMFALAFNHGAHRNTREERRHDYLEVPRT